MGQRIFFNRVVLKKEMVMVIIIVVIYLKKTETPSNHPSSFPYNKPNILLASVLSKVSTYEPTGMLLSELLMDPSG